MERFNNKDLRLIKKMADEYFGMEGDPIDYLIISRKASGKTVNQVLKEVISMTEKGSFTKAETKKMLMKVKASFRNSK